MAWGVINVMDRRKEFVECVLSGRVSMAEACRLFEISRQNGYKWVKRYLVDGEQGLYDRSRAPLTQPLKVDLKKEKAILEVRYREKTWGPKKILGDLRMQYPDVDWPSMTTIGTILDRNGLVIPRKCRKRVPGKTVPLSEALQPNDRWSVDFKGWFLTSDGGKCEPFTLTDGATRFLLRCLSLPCKNVEHVWAVLDTVFREHGLPLFLRSDNGPPFATCGVGRLSQLSVKLIKAGVTPEWIDPGKPQQNGSHERMHLTLKNETASPPAESLDKQAKRFKEFIEYFNYRRPHEALGQIPPGHIYSSSPRSWCGKLNSPEYPSDYIVRKVKSCGKLSWKWEELYLGRTLSNEPLGIKESVDGIFTVYYGPIILGVINHEKKFEVPAGNKRKR